MTIPHLPFQGFKWHWLHYQPSEGLLRAPVYLGVLRALRDFEGQAYSSIELRDALATVQEETESTVTLGRDPSRNLFRNSGQYWRGTGLLNASRGVISLTGLGKQVANGEITQDAFASLMITNTVLPNAKTFKASEIALWNAADLRIKPFELIIQVMSKLGILFGKENAYITPNELIKLLIPLSGAKATTESIARNIQDFRNGTLDISSWPDCAPAANDKRLAREFLLFLSNFDICRIDETETSNYEHRFILDEFEYASEEIPVSASSILETEDEPIVTIEEETSVEKIIERQRVATTILSRPNQGRFRKQVLHASQSQCLLTGEMTKDVLEAAHIIPVSHGGSDLVDNGLCLRMDIHKLYDSGKIRIRPSGDITLHHTITSSVSYGTLPSHISFPLSVNTSNVEWRDKYL